MAQCVVSMLWSLAGETYASQIYFCLIRVIMIRVIRIIINNMDDNSSMINHDEKEMTKHE